MKQQFYILSSVLLLSGSLGFEQARAKDNPLDLRVFLGQVRQNIPFVHEDAIERSRASALLPRVRLSAQRGLGLETGLSTSSQRSSSDQSESLAVVLEWDLSQAVFGEDEVQLQRDRAAFSEKAFERQKEALALLMEWERSSGMRKTELCMMLDLYTGGWFSEQQLQRLQVPQPRATTPPGGFMKKMIEGLSRLR